MNLGETLQYICVVLSLFCLTHILKHLVRGQIQSMPGGLFTTALEDFLIS